jgi:hypothetical protein
MPKTIAVFRTVGSAFNGAFRSARELVPQALAPLAVSVTLAVIREYLFEPDELLLFPAQLYSLLSALPIALFAFTCHRTCLRALGVGSRSTGSSEIAQFIAWSLAALTLFALVEIVAPSFAIGPSGELVRTDGEAGILNHTLTIVSVVVVVRSSLILPATAAGERADLRLAWARSRGNALRLFWAASIAPGLVLFPMLIALQFNGLLLIPSTEQLPAFTPTRVAVNVALGATTYLAAALGAFVLCHVYAQIRSDTRAA